MQSPELWPSERWADHFRRNREASLPPSLDDSASLTDAERKVITSSVQAFQLGENSEGRNLLHAAQAYARKCNDPAYVDAIRLFIAEEQRHALYLAKFMAIEGIPRIKKNWTDSVFRLLRKPMGLETSISVLLVAEVIAAVYYDALRESTSSPLLKRICDQILRDEDHHIRFQSERLGTLRKHRSRLYSAISNTIHRVLFFGTCFVVWREHRRVFRAGGFHFRRYWKACWGEMGRAISLIRQASEHQRTIGPTHSDPPSRQSKTTPSMKNVAWRSQTLT